MPTSVFSPRTDFTLDVLGRYICNGRDEAINSTGGRLDARPFDIIVIGGGTFGAAFAEHIWFRDTAKALRILVLEAGPFVLPEHNQNLPMVGLGVADASSVAEYNGWNEADRRKWRKEVWGLPWHSSTKFPGLAYCVGGRSLYWGGWSPRLLKAETPVKSVPLPWPESVVDELRAPNSYFDQAAEQIGVTETNDFMFGELHTRMLEQLLQGYGDITHALPTSEIESHLQPPTLDKTKLLRDNLEAPLAVQGRAPRAGFFPFNKFSSVPVLMKAVRAAQEEANNDDIRKRVMVAPHCNVSRLITQNSGGLLKVVGVETNQGSVPLADGGAVVIALGTIESTRLALNSFQGIQNYGLIGRNLMAHLRSNVDIRVPRDAIKNLPAAIRELQTSALFVKGRAKVNGKQRYFHLQITASGLGRLGGNSEAELWKKVPDLDGFEPFKHITDSHIVITIRGIGEMEPWNPDNPDAQKSRVRPDPNGDSEFGVPRALVEIHPTGDDVLLWDAMDQASDDVAKIFSGGLDYEVFTPQGVKPVKAGDKLKDLLFYAPKGHPDATKQGRRDGLGTTHHETGTLWMGEIPSRSVTNPDGRFHHVSNAYVVGPALFPTIGSPNPMLTGIALARRLGDHLGIPKPFAPDSGFTVLFNGFDMKNWAMTTIKHQPGRGNPGSFRIWNGAMESVAGNDMGILWCKTPMPANYILKLEWLRWTHDSNSGVYLRFPDPESKGYDNAAFVPDHFGFEVQIDEVAAKGIHRTGAIYRADNREDNEVLTQKAANPAGQWNLFEIHVKDQQYVVWLNGDVVCRFNNPYPGRGLSSTAAIPTFIGLQCYANPAWSVAYRNIQFKPI